TSRVLILGTPGVQATHAAAALASELRRTSHDFSVIPFEKTYLWQSDVSRRASLFNSPLNKQRIDWQAAWKRFQEAWLENPKKSNLPLILTLHGCFTTEQNGVWSIVDIHRVAATF